jgi:glycerol-3-phosphate dehydrogenase (NAD(P)+)
VSVAVIGGGAWGTALANAAALAGQDPVVLWMRDPAAAGALDAARENARYLPGIPLDPRVRPTADPAALAGAAIVLVVLPTQALRGALAALGPALPDAPLVLCAKGIERGSNRFPSAVAQDILGAGRPVAVLSGPSFAADVARGLPTAVTLAAPDADLAQRLAEALSGPALRLYHTTDRLGAEVGGAGKNVLAIACGAVHGAGLGESARAALVARGFAELARLARVLGARPETLMGLSGLGDLVLTASPGQSRNFAFGERVGRGTPVAEAAAGKLVEGALTAEALVALARAHGIEMPVSEAVAALVAGGLGVGDAVAGLMRRPLRGERE